MASHSEGITVSQLPSWHDPIMPRAEGFTTFLHRRPFQPALRAHFTKCGVFGHGRVMKIGGQVALRAYTAGHDSLSTHQCVHSTPVALASAWNAWRCLGTADADVAQRSMPQDLCRQHSHS
eukprot:1115892-Amphidinium_carterae.1